MQHNCIKIIYVIHLLVFPIRHFVKNAYDYYQFQTLVQQVLIVLKAVAGNDEVKVAIVQAGGAELILDSIAKHQRQVSQSGFVFQFYSLVA